MSMGWGITYISKMGWLATFKIVCPYACHMAVSIREKADFFLEGQPKALEVIVVENIKHHLLTCKKVSFRFEDLAERVITNALFHLKSRLLGNII